MNNSFWQPSRRGNNRRLADSVPRRLARFTALTVALIAAGLVAGCSATSSNSAAAVAPKAAAASVTASAAASATPTPLSPTASPLTTSPVTASPATSSPAPLSTVGNGTQLGAYTFDLTNAYAAPLGPNAPTQAEMLQVNSAGSCDIVYNGDIGSCNQEKMISLPNGSVPTYSACTTGTIFETSVTPARGTSFCIIETSGQVAGVTVASVSSSSSYVSFKIAVWKYVA
jgi:hypothetical protein